MEIEFNLFKFSVLLTIVLGVLNNLGYIQMEIIWVFFPLILAVGMYILLFALVGLWYVLTHNTGEESETE